MDTGKLQKISDVVVERIDYERITREIDGYKEELKRSENADNQIEILKKVQQIEEHVASINNLIDIRFGQNTEDSHYEEEKSFKEKNNPEVTQQIASFYEELYNSKFRGELEKKLGSVTFQIISDDVKSTGYFIIDDMIKEGLLVMDYVKLIGSIMVPFRGEILPLAAFRQYMTSPDRDERKDATMAQLSCLVKYADELDGMFDKLVKLRHSMAKQLGLKDFIELAGCRLHRCYSRDEVGKFRHNVRSYVLPIVQKIKRKVQDKLGIDELKPFDNATYSKTTPQLAIKPDQLVPYIGEVYEHIGPEASALFKMVEERDALDLFTRPNKAAGGRCYFIPSLKSPFIHANLTGKSPDDVSTLVHELGHGLGFYGMSFNEIYKNTITSYDVIEVHSMGMEMLSFDFIGKLFEDGGEEFIRDHLFDDLSFLTYGVVVDRFQELVFANTDWTPKDRNEAWKKLESKYRPYINCDGLPFFEDGRMWEKQIHIYMEPFYYIDYCLAQMIAFQFLIISKDDRAKAYEKYMEYIKFSGKMTFIELIDHLGLKNPFKEEDFKEIIDGIVKITESFDY